MADNCIKTILLSQKVAETPKFGEEIVAGPAALTVLITNQLDRSSGSQLHDVAAESHISAGLLLRCLVQITGIHVQGWDLANGSPRSAAFDLVRGGPGGVRRLGLKHEAIV